MKLLVYNIDTGEIIREINGPIDLDVVALEGGEDILSEEDVDIPYDHSRMMVDTEAVEIVDDPDAAGPPDRDVLVEDYHRARKAGNLQEQLDALFRLQTGEEP